MLACIANEYDERFCGVKVCLLSYLQYELIIKKVQPSLKVWNDFNARTWEFLIKAYIKDPFFICISKARGK